MSGVTDALPVVREADLPSLDAGQMREVDRIAVEEFGLGLLQMMENAGRSLAELALRRFAPESALILAGSGGNGGGGLACARHLFNRGVEVSVVLSHSQERLGEAASRQLRTLSEMGLSPSAEPGPSDLIIDAMIGYSLAGPPRGRIAGLIRWGNSEETPILALDVPSGFDALSGKVLEPAIRATATLTLALPKLGLAGADQTGELYLADISIPPAVYASIGLEVTPLFREGGILRVIQGEGLP